MKDAQLLMLQRLYTHLRDGIDREDEAALRQSMDALDRKWLTVIESLIVDPADVEFLEQQMLTGKVELKDLRPIISGGRIEEPETADDEPRKTVRKTPAKAPKKTAKKTVARASRTKK